MSKPPAPPPPTAIAEADAFDCDYLVIGSGFGGSVSALRLAEKGYKVIVLERGRRWRREDFPKTNWNVFKSMWLPSLGCTGILRLSILSDVFALSGAGVGGGSLVYANTLLVPPRPFFEDPQWAEMADWHAELAPHYDTARRMLGAVRNPVLGPADDVLREVAEEMGVADTVDVTDVGVFFGESGVEVDDPYFDGKGPRRVGCTQCGACMTGCKEGAKNTLDQNYLYLAEALGARIIAEREATDIACIGGPDARGEQGWAVQIRPSVGVLARKFGRTKTLRARQVVLSCGVLGTLPLLMHSQRIGNLRHLPESLGDQMRTNSEAVLGAMSNRATVDYSKGVAITSSAYFDAHTHIEVVRYGAGQDMMASLATVAIDGDGSTPRWLRWLGTNLRHPLDAMRRAWPFGWAERSVILLVMQTLDNRLRGIWRRSRLMPWRHVLATFNPSNNPNPTWIPLGNEVARRVARRIGGQTISTITEVALNIPTTAHILGGCPIGPDVEHGVIDGEHRVFNYQGLMVCDGSMMPANLGVNPSLTITAMTERAMSLVPSRSEQG